MSKKTWLVWNADEHVETDDGESLEEWEDILAYNAERVQAGTAEEAAEKWVKEFDMNECDYMVAHCDSVRVYVAHASQPSKFKRYLVNGTFIVKYFAAEEV